jgi:hypothetical protein
MRMTASWIVRIAAMPWSTEYKAVGRECPQLRAPLGYSVRRCRDIADLCTIIFVRPMAAWRRARSRQGVAWRAYRLWYLNSDGQP